MKYSWILTGMFLITFYMSLGLFYFLDWGNFFKYVFLFMSAVIGGCFWDWEKLEYLDEDFEVEEEEEEEEEEEDDYSLFIRENFGIRKVNK